MKNYLSSDESKTLWQKIMTEINQLPSLPEVIVRLIKELDNKETNPEILEKIIIND